MDNYMRTMIYLKRKEDVEQSVGYLRLERKGGYLLFSLVLTGASVSGECPVYVVYDTGDTDDRQQIYRLGSIGSDGSCEGRILLSQLPMRKIENRIYGALVGTGESYLTGTVDSRHELPVWQDTQVVEKMKTDKVILQAAEEPTVKRESSSVREFFDDDEMVWCRRIDPTEVSNFDMEEWYLAANSFLLQGFYNYHHLIYASDGEKVYLGVPGQYQRREMYMAKRFGFPYFKSRKNKSLNTGDFGYWLREIKRDEQE